MSTKRRNSVDNVISLVGTRPSTPQNSRWLHCVYTSDRYLGFWPYHSLCLNGLLPHRKSSHSTDSYWNSGCLLGVFLCYFLNDVCGWPVSMGRSSGSGNIAHRSSNSTEHIIPTGKPKRPVQISTSARQLIFCCLWSPPVLSDVLFKI